MFETRARNASTAASVDLAPLIDVVFLLLIFFLVSTQFFADTGIEVERPQATSGSTLDITSVRVSIAASGAIYHDGRAVDLADLPGTLRQELARDGSDEVVIVSDRSVPSGRLVAVMDARRLAGANHVSVATRDSQEASRR